MSIPSTNVLGSQIQATNTAAKPLVLNEGQMVHGKIKQLFPGQLAEVQIGDQKMIAKLDVPMRAGDSYYFQVSSVQPEIQLKIISGPTNAQTSTGQQMQNLMQAMQLPKSPEMTTLLSFVLDNKIPISREGLLQAVKLLQMTPSANHQEALQSIQKLLDLKLPLTQSLFQSVLGVESKAGMHSVMQSLMNALQQDSSVAPDTSSKLLQTMSQLQKPFGEVTSQATLGESLKILLDTKQSPELRFSALQLLKDSGVLPRTASLPNLQSTLTSTIAQQAGLPPMTQGNLTPPQLGNLNALLAEIPILTAGQKESLIATARSGGMQPFANALMQMIGESVAANPGQLTSQGQQKILSLLNMTQSAGSAPNSAETVVAEKMSQLLQNAEKSEHAVIRSLVQNAEATVSATMDGKVMKEAMQTILRSFGMNYEAQMMTKGSNPEQLAEQLKPQLLALLNDASISSTVKNAAEQVIVRMNGGPLLSAENGVNHQLIMQIPLEFFGKKIDATLQWNGRMKDDKKIDADYARILFYLNLHSLAETVVDMQVQNRVVTVTVFNAETALQAIGHPLQERLKDGLSAIGYTLSGVFFKAYTAEKKQQKPVEKAEVYEGGGVDFRI